jgi:pSer/pThr/pTyr-binding forkhead associated (FHA) protein
MIGSDDVASSNQRTASGKIPIAEMHALNIRQVAIVLKPVSHPELNEIRIDENLFAIGRGEAPFAAYAQDIVADLSRRHARIFVEYGTAYLADMGSKNGTSVNGVELKQKITQLQNGDEICFGKTLSYQVQLHVDAGKHVSKAKLLGVTLSPDRNDLGLQPIVITQFPFLISKADATFARYKDVYPHQVNYLSRRHAHIFLKGDEPFIEDLGSTNGTFVAGKRLDERAVALHDDDTLAFGGHHFVYRVSVQKESASVMAADPTLTKLSLGVPKHGHPVAEAEKTTFIAAADSFLDIFCVEPLPSDADAKGRDGASSKRAATESGSRPIKRARRGRWAVFLSELASAFSGQGNLDKKRIARWGMVFGAFLIGIALVVFTGGSPQHDMETLLADGEYAKAAVLANGILEHEPANAGMQVLGSEALLKAQLPQWNNQIRSNEFDRAAASIWAMYESGRFNSDVRPYLDELDWVGKLEKFVHARGGADVPIRSTADAKQLKTLLQHWDEGKQAHQRIFATISSYVPEFKDTYAVALSHLRKLELVNSQSQSQAANPSTGPDKLPSGSP